MTEPNHTMDARRDARDDAKARSQAVAQGHSIADAALALVHLWRAVLQAQVNMARAYADSLEQIGSNLGLGA